MASSIGHIDMTVTKDFSWDSLDGSLQPEYGDKFLHLYRNLSTQHAFLLLHHCDSRQVCFILVIDPSSILATTVIPLLVNDKGSITRNNKANLSKWHRFHHKSLEQSLMVCFLEQLVIGCFDLTICVANTGCLHSRNTGKIFSRPQNNHLLDKFLPSLFLLYQVFLTNTLRKNLFKARQLISATSNSIFELTSSVHLNFKTMFWATCG